ncbi:MAG: dihydrolipoyl dehydrogenase, partial [Oscillospiraceae bacterium]|nr:dihydrolipoyl dehydrogenase [Oscillospiraceae bacterium]
AQLLCPNASDMISQLSEAIANHMTPQQLLRAMRPHPTFEEALGDALSDLDHKLNKSL